MTLTASSYVGRRPMVDVSANWDLASRPTLADLQAATAGQFAAGTQTAGIITRIVDYVTALNTLDAAGAIPASERRDYNFKQAQIPFLLRQLGLYPPAAVTAAQALSVG